MKAKLSHNPKVQKLINHIAGQIREYADEQLLYIENLKNIGIAISTEKDTGNILELILNAAISYTNADGATIYMLSSDAKELDFRIIYNKSLNVKIHFEQGKSTWSSIPLYEEDGSKRQKNLAACVFHCEKELVFDNIYEQNVFDTSGTK
ncbi:MAG: hypothetical protein PHR06_15100, partial [Candidatus Cloacimonetes bacterium]|nr:hypothetical protein [Candidatus Cloacimonadota bacterium]